MSSAVGAAGAVGAVGGRQRAGLEPRLAAELRSVLAALDEPGELPAPRNVAEEDAAD